jgi:hypothetical protein
MFAVSLRKVFAFAQGYGTFHILWENYTYVSIVSVYVCAWCVCVRGDLCLIQHLLS